MVGFIQKLLSVNVEKDFLAFFLQNCSGRLLILFGNKFLKGDPHFFNIFNLFDHVFPHRHRHRGKSPVSLQSLAQRFDLPSVRVLSLHVFHELGNGTFLALNLLHLGLKVTEHLIFFLCHFLSEGKLVSDEHRLG